MIQNVEVKVNEKSLEISSTKAITGEICFNIENQFFPESVWNDFVVVILAWWIEALLDLIKLNSSALREFDFMDGPYLVRGKKIEDDIINLDFVKKRGGEKTLFSARCSIKQFKNSLLLASRRVIEIIEREKWDSQETKLLRDLTNRLNSLEN